MGLTLPDTQAVKMTTPNDSDDEQVEFRARMELVYQAAANGAMILPTHMGDAFFKAMTAWNLEHCVGSERGDGDEWRDCAWQKAIILALHERWAGFAYEEDEEEGDD
jgi:hypothetical protein